jgi:hypothetical protein
MHFIDADISGLRSAIIRLRSLSAQCNYTLIPVLPVGEQSYYDELRQELERHDVILHEAFDHPLERGLARDYEKIAASPRIKLVTSHSALDMVLSLRGKYVHIGVSAEDFGDELPRRQHWLTLLVRRVILTWLGRFGDRMDLFNNLNAFNHRASLSIHALRRKSIQSKLQKFHETVADKPISIAVLVTIARMPVISRHLIDRHYFDAFQSRWVRVFEWRTPGVPADGLRSAGLKSPGPAEPVSNSDAELAAKAFLKARFKSRRGRSALINVTRGLLQLLLRAGLGAGIAAAIYFGWLSLKTLPYRWEDMDWNNDGRVTLGEFLEVGGTDIRRVIRNNQLCIEVFSRRDGSILKSHCYP